MSLRKFIIVLSALIAMSPLMSQLAMAGASHDHHHDNVRTEVMVVSNDCNCCGQDSGQNCPDSGCECDACVSTVLHSFSLSQTATPHLTIPTLLDESAFDKVLAVVVPPPIVIL